MIKVKVAKPRISLIVSVHNDEVRLPGLLDSAVAARHRYRAGERGVEFIVVDRGSSDDSVAVARARGCRVTETRDRAVGAARNAGVAVAAGDVFAFVNTEFEIDPETFNAIDAAVETDSAGGGVTGAVARASDKHPGGPLKRALLGVRRSLGLGPGVVFCRRELFQEIGGYGEHRRVPDEVRLLKAVAAAGKVSGQPLVRVESAPARVAASRFRDVGLVELLRDLPPALSWRFFLRRAFRAAAGGANAGKLSDAE